VPVLVEAPIADPFVEETIRRLFAKQPKAAAPDPVMFAVDTLGHSLWAIQRRILAALAVPGARVAVKACHASSKTFCAAEAVLWAPHAGGIVITTAPTARQVRRLVWAEVRRLYPAARHVLGGELLQTEYRLDAERYALGLSTDTGVNLQGFHARPGGFLLVIADEAPGLEPSVLTAVEGMRAGGDVRVLLLGNPDVTSGPFYDVFHDQRAGWDCLTIDAFDTPNLAGLTLSDLLALPEHELDRNERPYLITRRFVREKYDEVGEDSAFWQSRIRGQFPAQSEDSLLSLAWLEAAAKREYQPREGDEWEAAIDVAGPGEDETVAGVRCGPLLVAMHGWAGADPRGDVLAWLEPWRDRLRRVKVDSAGLGYYFARHLEEQGYAGRVVDVNVGEAAADKERYVNLKAELYWGLHLRFKPDNRGHADVAANGDPAALPPKAIAQLSSIHYKHDARGRVVVESKEDARKRGVKSPDWAECVMLLFAAPQRPTWQWGAE
jgi:phage terminase large subunit